MMAMSELYFVSTHAAEHIDVFCYIKVSNLKMDMRVRLFPCCQTSVVTHPGGR